jgi:hypothetical protein
MFNVLCFGVLSLLLPSTVPSVCPGNESADDGNCWALLLLLLQSPLALLLLLTEVCGMPIAPGAKAAAAGTCRLQLLLPAAGPTPGPALETAAPAAVSAAAVALAAAAAAPAAEPVAADPAAAAAEPVAAAAVLAAFDRICSSICS